MSFDPLFSAIIIAGLLVIGAIALIPVVRPLFNPITQLVLHPQPEQKYVLLGIYGLAILGFIALLIFAISSLTRTPNQVTPDAIDALPTTFPSEAPIEQ